MTTGETITLVGNSGLIGVHDNVVGNSLVVKGNTGAFTRITDNEVGVTQGGSITIANNSSQVVVKRNSAANKFACSANDPGPSRIGKHSRRRSRWASARCSADTDDDVERRLLTQRQDLSGSNGPCRVIRSPAGTVVASAGSLRKGHNEALRLSLR